MRNNHSQTGVYSNKILLYFYQWNQQKINVRQFTNFIRYLSFVSYFIYNEQMNEYLC